MAKKRPDDKAEKSSGKSKEPPPPNMDGVPEALQEAGRRAAEFAQNPFARSLITAGLVAATAALASNKKVRKATSQNLREATEAAGLAAQNAGKIGVAIIEAATDAVQRALSAGADMTGGASGSHSEETAAPAATSAFSQAPNAPAAPEAPAAPVASTAPSKPRKPRAPRANGAPAPADSNEEARTIATKPTAKKSSGKDNAEKPAAKRAAKRTAKKHS